MTREQLIARFTRHPSPDAKQDKSGSGHAAIADAAASFALTLFERVPSVPHAEAAMREALRHVEAAVDVAVDTLEDHVAEPVDAAPTFAPAVEPVAAAVDPAAAQAIEGAGALSGEPSQAAAVTGARAESQEA